MHKCLLFRVELRAKFAHTAVEPSQLSFKEVRRLVACDQIYMYSCVYPQVNNNNL